MTYLDLLNGFHDLLMRSQVSKNGQLLYHTLLMINKHHLDSLRLFINRQIATLHVF